MNKRIRKKLATKKVRKVKPISNRFDIPYKATNIPILKPADAGRYLYRPRYNLGGMYWYFHQNDVDGWPSRPHGDQIGGPHKLNVYTGEIVNRNTKKIVKLVPKKELKRLWNDQSFKNVVKKSKQFS